uniref:Uncharacterized protein n=1 Tax=Trypanosoma vivax (strain Y486) TaxID=1055687 RepID=G0U0K7_TRYVY|nr:hypothetical protein, unlikely [Trypanosoma vivax Y486]
MCERSEEIKKMNGFHHFFHLIYIFPHFAFCLHSFSINIKGRRTPLLRCPYEVKLIHHQHVHSKRAEKLRHRAHPAFIGVSRIKIILAGLADIPPFSISTTCRQAHK